MAIPRLVALLALALTAPSVAAGAPVEGWVESHDPFFLRGAIAAEASAGALDLSADATRAGDLVFGWERAQGRHVRFDALRGPQGVGQQGGEPENESIGWETGELRILACDAGCLVVAYAHEGGVVALDGNTTGARLSLEPVARAFVAARGPGGARQIRDTFAYHVEPGWLRIGDRGLALDDARPRVDGEVGLLVFGAEVEVTSGGRTTRLWTGERDEPIVVGPGVPVGVQHRTRFVELHLSGARVALGVPSGATLVAPAARLHLDGTLLAPHAHGALDGSGAFDDTTLHVDGVLRLDVSVARAELAPLVGSHTQRAAFSGEAERVVVAGQTLVLESAQAGLPAAAVVGAALLALVLLARSFFVSLVSRIEPAAVLANANRRRVYEAVRERPGVTVAALSRVVRLQDVVTSYHLRRLESFRLVSVVESGRQRLCFPAGGGPSHAAEMDRARIGEGSRALLARALLAAPGASQADLVGQTRLSQRLVAYHLARLTDAELVTVAEGRPRAYRPTARLAAALQDVVPLAAMAARADAATPDAA